MSVFRGFFVLLGLGVESALVDDAVENAEAECGPAEDLCARTSGVSGFIGIEVCVSRNH